MPVRTSQIYPRSISYAVGSNPSTGPFAIPFPFQDQDEIEVRVDGVVEPNVTITQASTYGISGNTVTLSAAVSNATVLILSVTEEVRVTGALFGGAEASEEFDHLYAILQELRDRLIRLDVDLEHWDAATKRLRNLSDPVDAQDAATKGWVEAAPGVSIAEATAAAADAEAALASVQAITGSILKDAGAWASATAYEAGDVVTQGGSSYIAEVDHTSTGSFSTDLVGGNWRLLAAQGPAGAGSGDVLAANNGTEFTADNFAANLNLARSYTAQFTGDLNTFAATALRRIGTGATNGWTGMAAGDHVLHLQHDANTALQVGYDNSGDIFFRRKASGTWGPWFELATISDLDALPSTEWTSAFVDVSSGTPAQADFALVGSDIEQIQIMFDGVSVAGTDMLVRLGTGGVETAVGYDAGSTRSGSVPSATDGMIIACSATRKLSGIMTLQKEHGTNKWIQTHMFRFDGGAGNGTAKGAGKVTLAGAIDFIRVRQKSAGNFDDGQISIRYR